MNDEELLWELAEMEPPEVTGAGTAGAVRDLPVSVLEEYRSGQLPDRETERVEDALVASRSERRRLEALAGIRILAPASVRRRLFGDVVGKVERPARAAWRAAPWRILAAASVGLFALLCLWQAGQRGLLPGIHRRPAVSALPEYRVELEGTAPLRSVQGTPGSGGALAREEAPQAAPETVVAISVLPETAPSTPVAFGVYRRESNNLRRVPPGEILSFEENRGAASLRLTAASLVGRAAGTRSFYLVVTEPGRLREELSVAGASSAAAALQNVSGGRVYERSLTIVDREPDGKPN